MRAAFAAVALVLFAYSGEPCAADADLQIVLAADVSRSIDDEEYALERRGYADAIQSQQLLDFRLLEASQIQIEIESLNLLEFQS